MQVPEESRLEFILEHMRIHAERMERNELSIAEEGSEIEFFEPLDGSRL